jgi:hypothetical protein
MEVKCSGRPVILYFIIVYDGDEVWLVICQRGEAYIYLYMDILQIVMCRL